MVEAVEKSEVGINTFRESICASAKIKMDAPRLKIILCGLSMCYSMTIFLEIYITSFSDAINLKNKNKNYIYKIRTKPE